MKILLSPSKTMNLKNQTPAQSIPVFKEEAKQIIDALSSLNVMQLASLYNISESLAHKVYDMLHQKFQTQAAIGYFKGEAFKHLDYLSMSSAAQVKGQDSLLVLCALYGFLRPFDGITPYRMDFLVDLEQLNLENSYHFYQERISHVLTDACQPNELIINLASLEFSKVIDQTVLPASCQWIDVEFMTLKNNKLKTVSMIAKRARGSYARYLLEHDINDFNDLWDIKKFDDFTLDESYQRHNVLRYIQD